jgi:hypothetical protein
MTGWRATITTAGAASLLAAACVAWSAIPLRPTGPAKLALFLAVACAALGVLRLALASVAVPAGIFLSGPQRIWVRFLLLLRLLPEEEGTVLAVLWLEVQHPARPWHTAALGAALVAYLLAVHLDESGSTPRALRRQAPLLAVGACLLAAGAGAAMIPAVGAEAGPDWLRVLASAAAVGATLLIVPVTWPGRGGAEASRGGEAGAGRGGGAGAGRGGGAGAGRRP